MTDRALAIVAASLFVISSLFPIAAAVTKDVARFPVWIGPLDGMLAFALVVTAFVVVARTQHQVDRNAQEAAYRWYRAVIHGLMVLLVVFFLFGDRINWAIGLVGLAWRTWLLLYVLPFWLVAYLHRRTA